MIVDKFRLLQITLTEADKDCRDALLLCFECHKDLFVKSSQRAQRTSQCIFATGEILNPELLSTKTPAS